jgi:hypothetical protein
MSTAMLNRADDKWQDTQFDLSSSEQVITSELVRPLKGKLPNQNIVSYLSQSAIDVSSLALSENVSLGTAAMEIPGKEPVPTVNKSTITQSQFVSLQKWQGAVLEVKKDSFIAKLTDLTEKGSEEEAEFSLEEVSDDDKNLIVPGGVFYWNIGYQISYQGQQTRASIIRFRRVPVWRKEELDAAKSRAQKIQDYINWK